MLVRARALLTCCMMYLSLLMHEQSTGFEALVVSAPMLINGSRQYI